MSDSRPAAETLSLEYDSPELPIGQLNELVRHFTSMVEELRAPGLPDEIRVTWVVERISKSSPFTITVAPVARMHRVAVDAQPVQDLPALALDGIEQLMHEAKRPAIFSDGVLTQLRTLSKIVGVANRRVMSLRANGKTVEVTGQLAVNVDKILAPAYRSVGTIEGRMDIINAHEDPFFVIYDDLTGERVRATLGRDLSVDEVAKAIRKRVAVEGEISYRDNGTIISINADTLTVFPSDDELPSIEEIIGIFSR